MLEYKKNASWKRIIRLMNKGHSYAGVFTYDSSDNKRMMEESTIEEWRTSMKAEFGIETEEPQPNQDDPPDFFVSIRGQRLAVELVQLVQQGHKRRATRGESPLCGQLFLDMQWSRKRLASKIQEIISRKGEKYGKAGVGIDILVIHTDETWLSSTQAREWIVDAAINTHPSIRTVFLILSYQPGRGVGHWPLFSIYGELT